MDFFSVLSMIGGLALFLYGMHVMGDGLSKVSGGKMEKILEGLTSNPLIGNGSYSVIFCNYGYGGGICKLRYYEVISGSGRNYGCKYRYNHYVLDFESFRN